METKEGEKERGGGNKFVCFMSFGTGDELGQRFRNIRGRGAWCLHSTYGHNKGT